MRDFVRNFFNPTLRIVLAVLSITVSLMLVAYSLGFLPDENKAALEARAKVSEALAIQIAVAASKNDEALIKNTIALVVARNHDIQSIAIRRSNGELFAQEGNHELHWHEPPPGRSTANHVQIPLTNIGATWGRIEIAFRPLDIDHGFLGLSSKMLILLTFLGGAGFAGYFLVLKRALRMLDPSQVIPERVRSAFDTLSEGVLILDEYSRVVLANRMFSDIVGTQASSIFGKPIDNLPWLQFDKSMAGEALPWRVAMREKKAVTGILMSMRTPDGSMRRFSASTTPIMDGGKTVRGAISSFHDFTDLHNKNEQLKYSVDQLRKSRAHVEEQNKQLTFLAACDSLTGCLNRRTFFAELEVEFQKGHSQNQSIALMLLDLDHFKKINDRFGHIVGDEVLVRFAQTISSLTRNQDLVGRYGGEEFCIALMSPADTDAKQLADRICQRVAAVSQDWLPNRERVTVSIGVASVGAEPCGVMDLVARADMALYAAKAAGRNRYIWWADLPKENRQNPAVQSPDRPRAA